jgi:hypothetical protein
MSIRIRLVEDQDTPKSPEEEWMDSVHAICFEMAQKPTLRRRSELMEEATFALHRYFGACAARK